MKFTTGETVTIHTADSVLVIKVEDASKGDKISARVESVERSGEHYTVGQIYDFNRDDIKDS
jgi:hypothetical protein